MRELPLFALRKMIEIAAHLSFDIIPWIARCTVAPQSAPLLTEPSVGARWISRAEWVSRRWSAEENTRDGSFGRNLSERRQLVSRVRFSDPLERECDALADTNAHSCERKLAAIPRQFFG